MLAEFHRQLTNFLKNFCGTLRGFLWNFLSGKKTVDISQSCFLKRSALLLKICSPERALFSSLQKDCTMRKR
jgi:hypothetical protein